MSLTHWVDIFVSSIWWELGHRWCCLFHISWIVNLNSDLILLFLAYDESLPIAIAVSSTRSGTFIGYDCFLPHGVSFAIAIAVSSTWSGKFVSYAMSRKQNARGLAHSKSFSHSCLNASLSPMFTVCVSMCLSICLLVCRSRCPSFYLSL